MPPVGANPLVERILNLTLCEGAGNENEEVEGVALVRRATIETSVHGETIETSVNGETIETSVNGETIETMQLHSWGDRHDCPERPVADGRRTVQGMIRLLGEMCRSTGRELHIFLEYPEGATWTASIKSMLVGVIASRGDLPGHLHCVDDRAEALHMKLPRYLTHVQVLHFASPLLIKKKPFTHQEKWLAMSDGVRAIAEILVGGREPPKDFFQILLYPQTGRFPEILELEEIALHESYDKSIGRLRQAELISQLDAGELAHLRKLAVHWGVWIAQQTWRHKLSNRPNDGPRPWHTAVQDLVSLAMEYRLLVELGVARGKCSVGVLVAGAHHVAVTHALLRARSEESDDAIERAFDEEWVAFKDAIYRNGIYDVRTGASLEKGGPWCAHTEFTPKGDETPPSIASVCGSLVLPVP